MAYAALVSVVQTLEQITQTDHYCILFPDKTQLESVHESFSFLLAFLEGDPTEYEEMIGHLEGKIREVAYRAQDIIEFHVSNLICPEKECNDQPRRVKRVSWRLLFAVQKVMSLRPQREKEADDGVDVFVKVSQDLRELVEEVDSIVEEVMKIKKRDHQKTEDLLFSNCPAYVGSPRQGPGRKTDMVGFYEDMVAINDQLCGGSSNLQVIPIVGMGGIGKTTLANNIFYDPLIVHHFHVRAWSTITQEYDMKEILLGLLSSLATVTEELSRGTEGVLMEHLHKSLKGRKYLIVLDDVWKTQAWDDVKLPFPDDRNGSRIILTTRLVDVAVYANPSGLFHQMQFLNKDESWNLLRQKVFPKNAALLNWTKLESSLQETVEGFPF